MSDGNDDRDRSEGSGGGDDNDDDWFERALREAETESSRGDDGERERADPGGDAGFGTGNRAGVDDGPGAEIGRDDGPSEGTAADDGRNRPGADDGSDGAAHVPESGDGVASGGGTAGGPASSGGASDGPVSGGGTADGTAEGGDTAFDTDFATALESAPDPGEFGGGPSADDPFGGSGADPFGGGPGEPSAGSFDDESFESDIDRIEIGIRGLDEMILGGVPERSLMVSLGSAGTGKTTFGLQFLEHALADGGTGVFITLEESRERILATAEEKGWPFREYEDDGRLAVIDLDPVEMASSLASIRNDLPRLIDDFGADRLVLDSVSLLEMMYDHPARRRSEVFDFSRALKDAGVTTMLTSEADGDNPYVSRYGIVEYLADAVFVLQYVRRSDFQETRLAVEIQKIRDANHSRETKPYEITDDGISVYRRANIF